MIKTVFAALLGAFWKMLLKLMTQKAIEEIFLLTARYFADKDGKQDFNSELVDTIERRLKDAPPGEDKT